MTTQCKELKENMFCLINEDGNLTDEGNVVADILMEYEDAFSEEAIIAAAEKINVTPNDLKALFEENADWKHKVLKWQKNVIEDFARELEKMYIANLSEWKIKKAFIFLEAKKKEKQEQQKEFHWMIDEFTDRLKKNGRSDKDIKKELDAILVLRKKIYE